MASYYIVRVIIQYSSNIVRRYTSYPQIIVSFIENYYLTIKKKYNDFVAKNKIKKIWENIRKVIGGGIVLSTSLPPKKKNIPLDELFFKFVEIAFDAFSRCVGLDNACRVFGLLPSFFMCEIMGYDIRPTKPTHLIPCLLVS